MVSHVVPWKYLIQFSSPKWPLRRLDRTFLVVTIVMTVVISSIRRSCAAPEEEAATLRLPSPPLRHLPQWSFPASLITAQFAACHHFSAAVRARVCVSVCVRGVCVWGGACVRVRRPGNQMSFPHAANLAALSSFSDHVSGGGRPHLRRRSPGAAH